MKRYIYYVKVLNVLTAYRISKQIFLELNGDGGYDLKSKYSLLADDGGRIENPATKKNSISLLIPVPASIISEKLTMEYVTDHCSQIDLIFASAGVSSCVKKTMKEQYDENSNMVYVCTWKLKQDDLNYSVALWLVLFSIATAIMLLLF